MIGFIVFGLLVGALARLILPGRQHLGIVATMLFGIVGSIIGGTVANALGTGDILELNLIGAVVAVVAAAVLIGIVDAGTVSRRRGRGRRR